LYDGIVYEVVQAQSVWVLKLKLVVVCEKSEQIESGQYLSAILAVLDVLEELSTVLGQVRELSVPS
jgi:hypothetical protein